jgi:hypothetical protein
MGQASLFCCLLCVATLGIKSLPPLRVGDADESTPSMKWVAGLEKESRTNLCSRPESVQMSRLGGARVFVPHAMQRVNSPRRCDELCSFIAVIRQAQQLFQDQGSLGARVLGMEAGLVDSYRIREALQKTTLTEASMRTVL